MLTDDVREIEFVVESVEVAVEDVLSLVEVEALWDDVNECDSVADNVPDAVPDCECDWVVVVLVEYEPEFVEDADGLLLDDGVLVTDELWDPVAVWVDDAV